MNRLLSLSSAVLATLTAQALQPGDLALVGWIDNGSPDSLALLTLAPLAAGQTVYFTDNGWTGTQFRGASLTDGDGNENLLKFTAVQDIAAGLIIRTSDLGPAFTWTMSGSIPGTTAGSFAMLSLNATGDQVYAFTAPDSNPLYNPGTQLFALDNTGSYEAATSSGTGGVPPDLTLDLTAITFSQTSTSFMAFNTGSLSSGTKEQWLAAIADQNNWTFAASGTLPSGSVNLVPEPGTLALCGVGGLILLRALKRPRR